MTVGAAAGLARFVNSRDLGGLARVGGCRTAFGRVIRSGTSAVHAPADRAAVQAAGLAAVVDLRSAREIEALPHPLARFPGYRHRPLIDEAAGTVDDTARATTLGEVYRSSLTRNAATIAAVMVAIAAAPSGPVMVCCTAGKDRTGMVAALLLRLAGVTRDAVGQDYALSGTAAGMPLEHPGGRADSRPVTATRFDPRSCVADDIQDFTDHLDDHFGGPRAYLEQLGLTHREIGALAHRLT